MPHSRSRRSPTGDSDEGEIRDDGMSPISDGGLDENQVSSDSLEN